MAAPGSVTASLPAARGAVDEASSALIQAGRRAWAAIGLTVVALAALSIVVRVEIVAVPLVIALLPAAALMRPVDQLRSTSVPSALSAALVLLAATAFVVVAVALAASPITAQLGVLGSAVQDALTRVQSWLSTRPLGLPALQISQLGERASQLALDGGVTQRVIGVADVAVRGITEVIIGLLALFFYLKDGRRIADWLKAVVAAAVYASRRVERIVDGDPVVIVADGRLVRSTLRRELITENEVLAATRNAGIQELADVLTILETTGEINVFGVDRTPSGRRGRWHSHVGSLPCAHGDRPDRRDQRVNALKTASTIATARPHRKPATSSPTPPKTSASRSRTSATSIGLRSSVAATDPPTECGRAM